MPMPQARGMFKRRLKRKWGNHIARGWASLLPVRLHGFVGTPENADYAHGRETERPPYRDHAMHFHAPRLIALRGGAKKGAGMGNS